MHKLFVLALAALIAACSTVPEPPASRAHLFDDAAFAPPAVRIASTDVFAMSPAMERFFEAEVARLVRARGPQQGLVDALYSSQKLRLAYDAAFTRNAAEAFDEREGNCLSLVIMTAAFAKRLGLEIRYQRVGVEDVWAREGDLVEVIGHVNLALGRPGTTLHRTQSPSDWMTIDFIPIEHAEQYRVQPLQEARVVAMYMNNKSVEALADGRTSDAYWWSRASIEHDPGFTSAYISLGVVLQRHGRTDLADAALRVALSLEPANPQALSNRVGVLTALGREEEAIATANALKRVQPSTPLTSYKSGVSALKLGNYARARDAFRDALRAAPDDHEFHFLLAVAYLKLGDHMRALDHLRRAHENSPKGERRTGYASKIQRLEGAAKASAADSIAR